MSLESDFLAKFSGNFTPDQLARLPIIEDYYSCVYNYAYGYSHCTDQAILYLVAHLLYLDSQAILTGGGPGSTPLGTPASKTVGNVSVSYNSFAFKSLGDADLFSTAYGREFWRLTRFRRGPLFA
jgi:hypothetical protein